MEQHGKVASLSRINNNSQSDYEDQMDLRRGPWTGEEDFTLTNYIAHHGEGRWNSLARCAGLKRTGKSCRLRWLNYLRPDVRRGNITLEEQLLILELHSRWGNRWSKIAQYLPGRTDNEIKNYWRTRVQKHAKQLNCDVNSKQFKDTMRYLWMPRLVERIQAAAGGSTGANTGMPSSSNTTYPIINHTSNDPGMGSLANNLPPRPINCDVPQAYNTPDNSSASASSDSFGTPGSDLTDCYNNNQDYYPASNNQMPSYGDQFLTSPTTNGYFDQGLLLEQNDTSQWMDGGDMSDNWWDADDVWYLQHHFNSNV